LDARREESFRGFLRTQLGDDIAMHLGTLAIDGALQFQTGAMIWRKLRGNHLTVMRSIVPTLCVFFDKRQQFPNVVVQRRPPGLVPEKLASVSPIPVFAMFNSESGGVSVACE
jgi:hypothetical protein